MKTQIHFIVGDIKQPKKKTLSSTEIVSDCLSVRLSALGGFTLDPCSSHSLIYQGNQNRLHLFQKFLIQKLLIFDLKHGPCVVVFVAFGGYWNKLSHGLGPSMIVSSVMYP